MTTVVPVRKRRKSRTIARLPINCCLHIDFEAAIAFAKIEDVLDATKTTKSSHLSPEALSAREALLQPIKMALRL